MMNNLLCKTFVMGALICSTQLSAQKVSDKQPWSVRMVESEMIRCPESWQLDFQPKLNGTIVMDWNCRLCWMCMILMEIKRYSTMRWLTQTQ